MVLEYMDNRKTPEYYFKKMISDIEFCILHLNGISIKEFCENEVLNSAISFKFVQISENAKKIPSFVVEKYDYIPWNKINGLRNKIVHDYGNIQYEIIYDTITFDLPDLLVKLRKIVDE
jgi:uncharacterized protein with HEPN domain